MRHDRHDPRAQPRRALPAPGAPRPPPCTGTLQRRWASTGTGIGTGTCPRPAAARPGSCRAPGKAPSAPAGGRAAPPVQPARRYRRERGAASQRPALLTKLLSRSKAGNRAERPRTAHASPAALRYRDPAPTERHLRQRPGATARPAPRQRGARSPQLPSRTHPGKLPTL